MLSRIEGTGFWPIAKWTKRDFVIVGYLVFRWFLRRLFLFCFFAGFFVIFEELFPGCSQGFWGFVHVFFHGLQWLLRIYIHFFMVFHYPFGSSFARFAHCVNDLLFVCFVRLLGLVELLAAARLHNIGLSVKKEGDRFWSICPFYHWGF